MNPEEGQGNQKERDQGERIEKCVLHLAALQKPHSATQPAHRPGQAINYAVNDMPVEPAS